MMNRKQRREAAAKARQAGGGDGKTLASVASLMDALLKQVSDANLEAEEKVETIMLTACGLARELGMPRDTFVERSGAYYDRMDTEARSGAALMS